MKTLLLALLLFSACSQLHLKVDGKESNSVKVIRHEKYQEITGAENVFRKVTGATVLIAFRQDERENRPQDLMGFSVGGAAGTKSLSSRISLRIEADGKLTGIARATDTEPGQNVHSVEPVAAGKFHMAALTVDYAHNEMKLYLDGKPIAMTGKPNFSAKETSDTSSLSAAIGSEDDGSTFFFDGELKSPMIWGRTLSPEEIDQEYHKSFKHLISF